MLGVAAGFGCRMSGTRRGFGAIMAVQLETGVPIISAVLTPHHFHEHDDHRKLVLAHFRIKGVEAAAACARTLENMAALTALDIPA